MGKGRDTKRIIINHVPKKLIERPKKGFSIPIDDWLRRPLRDWAESLLSPSKLDAEGFFDQGIVRQHWDEHISGKRNWQYKIWNILMFQAWLEKN